MKHVRSRATWALLVSCSSLMATATALAQTSTQAPTAPVQSVPTAPAGTQEAAVPDTSGEDIVVTGFRGSLSTALNQKRRETAAIDSIVAEDIGKFPDSNLAESMQRVPGVALSRGDGGEGRNISVRGLGAAFTRVRVNGMEGTSQTGASDIYGAGNSGRSFDFNVFPTELFSSLAVRKTPSADLEEGSLGATVDLAAPRPLDSRKDTVFTATLRGVYGELAKKVNPRASFLASQKFADGTLGVLVSGAYQKRNLREVGYSAVNIISADTNGLFCSPIGVTPVNPTKASAGADAANCATGNPRTGSAAVYNTITGLRRPDLPNVAGSGAFIPRQPRYLNSQQDQERYGGTFTVQFKPDDDTDVSVDLLYSRLDVTRYDNYIAGFSFSRGLANNGQPMVSVREAEFDSNGSLKRGVFDGMDVRSEGLVDHFVSTFKQANFNFKHRFNDSLDVSMLVGKNQSVLDGKQRFQTFIDAIDTRNFTYDATKGGTPILGFGIDVANPASFTYAPGQANGTVTGGYSFSNRPSRNTTDNFTGELNVGWKVADGVTLKGGGQYRESDYVTAYLRPYTADLVVRALPAGTNIAAITRQITGVDTLFGAGAPASWAAVDADKLRDVFGLDNTRFCGVECGGQRSRVLETVKSAYAMATFDLDRRLGFGLRGDLGVRYVRTDMTASGFIPATPPAGTTSPTGVVGQYTVARKGYQDWLPSGNVVIEPTENLLLRVSGAKVLARPELGLLTPTSNIGVFTRFGSVSNPFLDPIRANTADVALEWYFRPGALLSAAFFYKDIKSYIQSVSDVIPFNQLGLPDALLAGSGTPPTELFTIARPTNTPGGPLKGVEINAQLPFTFLGGFFGNFGVLANYTHVTSRIQYVLVSANGVPTVTTTNDLIGLSKNTASGTLYYEDKKFSIRSSANYRSSYIREIPSQPGSNLSGNRGTLFVDASASYNLTDNFKLIVEAQNLTDERNPLYVDSNRQDVLYETRIGRTVSAGVNVSF